MGKNTKKSAPRTAGAIATMLLVLNSAFTAVKSLLAVTLRRGVYPAFTVVACFLITAAVILCMIAVIKKHYEGALFFGIYYSVIRLAVIAFETSGKLTNYAALRIGLLFILICLCSLIPLLKSKGGNLIRIPTVGILIFSAAMCVTSAVKLFRFLSLPFWIFYTLFFTLSDFVFFAAAALISINCLMGKKSHPKA